MKSPILPLLVLASVAVGVSAAAEPPYPHSQALQSIVWHWKTYTNAALGSDLWPVAWGPDDQLYAAWGDGGGFGGSNTDGRVARGFARIEGTPEHWHGVNINGGKNPEPPASFPRKGKTSEVAIVDGVFYAISKLNGRSLWKTELPGSLSGDDFVTVRSDGQRVFAHTEGKLHCLDLADGRVLWSNELPGYGYGIASLCFPGGPTAPDPAAVQKRMLEQQQSSAATS
jgi:outer membrane protein assembly factor BamB